MKNGEVLKVDLDTFEREPIRFAHDGQPIDKWEMVAV